MLQPIGPQAVAGALKLLDDSLDVELVPIAPNTEKAFSPCSLPHWGHINSTLAVIERTNLSYF
jgi:hypothetical protein